LNTGIAGENAPDSQNIRTVSVAKLDFPKKTIEKITIVDYFQ